jgi:hypothetical protein
MFGHVAKKKAVHGEGRIRNTVDYVREYPVPSLRAGEILDIFGRNSAY